MSLIKHLRPTTYSLATVHQILNIHSDIHTIAYPKPLYNTAFSVSVLKIATNGYIYVRRIEIVGLLTMYEALTGSHTLTRNNTWRKCRLDRYKLLMLAAVMTSQHISLMKQRDNIPMAGDE